MKAKNYEITLCRDGNLYINKIDGNTFKSEDSKRLSENDLNAIKKWVDCDHEYVRTDAFIEKACDWMDKHCKLLTSKDYEDFRKYMRGE